MGPRNEDSQDQYHLESEDEDDKKNKDGPDEMGEDKENETYGQYEIDERGYWHR